MTIVYHSYEKAMKDCVSNSCVLCSCDQPPSIDTGNPYRQLMIGLYCAKCDFRTEVDFLGKHRETDFYQGLMILALAWNERFEADEAKRKAGKSKEERDKWR